MLLMLQCAWTSFNHRLTPRDANTIFVDGDPSTGMHDVPMMQLPLCEMCAKIYRNDVEPNRAMRLEIPVGDFQVSTRREILPR